MEFLTLDNFSKDVIFFVFEYGFFILCLFAFLYFFKKKTKKIELIDIIIVGVVIVVAAIRYNVGVDYLSYYNYYNTIFLKYSDFWEGVQLSNIPFLIYTIYYIGRNLWNNPYGFFWITSVIIYGVSLFTIIKRSERPAYSILLFGMMGFMGSSVNIIKQWLATAVLIYALKYIQKDKWLHFILLGVIALCFHQMAIVFVLLIFIAKKFVKPNKNWFRIMCIIGVVLVISFLMLPLVVKYIPFVNTDRFLSYFEDDSTGYSATRNAKLAMVFYAICYLPLIYIVVSNAKEIINVNKDNELYINMLLLSIPFIILALRKRYVSRIGMFLDIPIVYVLPLVSTVIKSEKYKKYLQIGISAIVIVFFISYTVLNRDIYYAYNTYVNLL